MHGETVKQELKY